MSDMAPDPTEAMREMVSTRVTESLRTAWSKRSRTVQKAERRVGVSDLGTCREYTRRMLVGEDFTDPADRWDWAAMVGTAVGDWIEQMMSATNSDCRTQVPVEVMLPSGFTIGGTADMVFGRTLLLDNKTRNGLGVVRRSGPKTSEVFQRSIYAYALIQAGELSEDCWVGNVFWDRSGDEFVPHVDVAPFDMSVIHEVDEWLSDVGYAIQHDEVAQKDPEVAFCEKACPFFTACRGGDTDATGLLLDPDVLAAVDMVLEARALDAQRKKLRRDAEKVLVGVKGTTGSHTVRWVNVKGHMREPVYVEAFQRLDIRPVPGA